MEKNLALMLVLLFAVITLSGCGGGLESSVGSKSIENELYAGLEYFCSVSDALDKDGLAQIFSTSFLSSKSALNFRMQDFMQQHQYGEQLDYHELMQYLDYEIARQRESGNKATTQITSFHVVWATSEEAVVSYQLLIDATKSSSVLDNGNLQWKKENGIWKIQSILGDTL